MKTMPKERFSVPIIDKTKMYSQAALRLYPDVVAIPSQPNPIYIQKRDLAISNKVSSSKNGGYLLSHGCAVPSARTGLTSLFGMGRGGTPTL